MNISQKFEILQKLDSLFTYSELLPEDFKKKYLNDLDHLKKRFSEFKANHNPVVPEGKNALTDIPLKDLRGTGPLFSGNTEKPVNSLEQKPLAKPGNVNSDTMPLKTFVSEPPPPPSVSIKLKSLVPVLPTKEITKDKTALSKNKKSTFETITNALIPKLTDEGKKMLGDFSLPIDLYLVLKSIDDKSSILKLFEDIYKLHATNFVSFANTLYTLEIEGYVYLIRTEETIINGGLLNYDELFSLGKVVPPEKLALAIEQHKPPGGLFSSKKLLELKMISNSILGTCTKVQKWIARSAEKAPYVEGHTSSAAKPEELEQNLAETSPVTQEKPVQAEAKNIPLIAPARPLPITKPIIKDDSYAKLLDLIIPVLNEKGKTIIDSPEHKELAARIAIIDGKTSLFKIFKTNKESFKSNILQFLKFILKLDSQEILVYTENEKKDEREVWIKFGELLIFLGIVNEERINYALNYQKEKKIYIGEALVELKYLEEAMLDECLKIQQWLNAILSNISYESSFVNVIQDVLKDSFKCYVEIGRLTKVSFPKPLKDIVYIQYSIGGKLNGRVFYISDRSFMMNLSKTIMNSVGNADTDEFDESYVSAVSSIIITNSLNKLSQMGLFSNSEIPKILMEKKVIMDEEVIIADNKTISLVPLINQWGRFVIGLEMA